MRFFQHRGLREGGCKLVIMGCRPFLQPYFVNGPLNHDGSAWAPNSESSNVFASFLRTDRSKPFTFGSRKSLTILEYYCNIVITR